MLKLNVGLSRKVGEPNYGSRGASVYLELEVESALAGDPDALRERVRRLFGLARASVDEELNPDGRAANANGQDAHDQDAHDQDAAQQAAGGENGDDGQRAGGRPATASQIRAIHAIAKQYGFDLQPELINRFGVPQPEDLLVSEASELIDLLKASANGGGGRR